MNIRFTKSLRIIILVLVLFSTAAFAGSMIVHSTLTPHPTWHAYGNVAIGTTARKADVASAIQQVCNNEGHWVQNADGSKTNPSYMGKSNFVSTNNQMILSRDIVKFDDTTGHTVQFEIVDKAGDEKLVFIEYNGQGGSLIFLNKLAQALKDEGVTYEKS